jgi:hypothetical protein
MLPYDKGSPSGRAKITSYRGDVFLDPHILFRKVVSTWGFAVTA